MQKYTLFDKGFFDLLDFVTAKIMLALGGIGVVGNLQGVQGFPGIANLQGVIGAGHGGIRTGDGVGVDAHYHPLVIYQGPAGVAGVDGGGGLDEV